MSVWAVTMMIGTMLGPHGAAHVEALDVGQAQVEQHEVGLVALERGQAAATVPGLLHLVALVLEGHADGQADLVVVLDEQQAVHADPGVSAAAMGPVVGGGRWGSAPRYRGGSLLPNAHKPVGSRHTPRP